MVTLSAGWWGLNNGFGTIVSSYSTGTASGVVNGKDDGIGSDLVGGLVGRE